MILFINACVRSGSRTKELADHVLENIQGTVKELRLWEIPFPKTDEKFIARRNRLAAAGEFFDPVFDLAKEFAAAEDIVIAAPFWDLSFPSLLKQYVEQICVSGVTFRYENNVPAGLCSAGSIIYVTTAGGYVDSYEFGYGYIKALAENFFGIKDIQLISAEGLDIEGADVRAIMQKAKDEYRPQRNMRRGI